jgi:hypothetical protein
VPLEEELEAAVQQYISVFPSNHRSVGKILAVAANPLCFCCRVIQLDVQSMCHGVHGRLLLLLLLQPSPLPRGQNSSCPRSPQQCF